MKSHGKPPPLGITVVYRSSANGLEIYLIFCAHNVQVIIVPPPSVTISYINMQKRENIIIFKNKKNYYQHFFLKFIKLVQEKNTVN